MAGVAIEVREIGFLPDEFGVGLPEGGGSEELGIDQGNLLGCREPRAETGHKLQAQGEEYHRQDQQHRACSVTSGHELSDKESIRFSPG
jgi:hypothetical protein